MLWLNAEHCIIYSHPFSKYRTDLRRNDWFYLPKDLTKLESIQDQECSAQRKVQKCSDRLGKRIETVSFEFAPPGAPKNDVFRDI